MIPHSEINWKNQKKPIFWAFSALVLVVPLIDLSANAETSTRVFRHEEKKFAVEIPLYQDNAELTRRDWRVQRDPIPNVGLVLKPELEQFPSFNVLVQSGAYQANKRSKSSQLKDILDSYQQVGLARPQVNEQRLITVGDRPGFETILQYNVRDQLMTSRVVVVSGFTRHYFLTYIDHAEDFSKRAYLADGLIHGFSTWEGDSNTADPQTQPHSPSPLWLLLPLALVAILVTGSVLFVLRTSQTKD